MTAHPVIAVLLLACGSRVGDDIATYTKLVGDGSVDADAGMAACLGLSDADLAGDCALHVVTVEAGREGGQPEALCERVPTGVWQDECWFTSAETYRRRHRDQYAATLCLKAGAFTDDCGQHLWQSQVHALVYRKRTPGFVDILDDAQGIYDAWAPHLAGDTDFERRFWAKVYQNGFEGLGTADLAWCDPVAERYGPDHAARCVTAALELYDRELGPRLDRAGVDLCSLDAPTSTDLFTVFAVPPDPRFDAVILARQARECRGR